MLDMNVFSRSMKCWVVATCLIILFGSCRSNKTTEPEGCLEDIDLVLLLDGSGSVNETNFDLVKGWVKRFAKDMNIEQRHVQIGVVQYSYYNNDLPIYNQPYIRTEIGLGTYTDENSFEAAVDAIKDQGSRTDTAHAINKTLHTDFLASTSRYPLAKRVLVLMTDGKASDSSDLPSAISHAAEKGVAIYAVGVGEYDLEELMLITGNKSSRIFELAAFSDLESVIVDLQTQVKSNCDCDPKGSLSNECTHCPLKRQCKSNVIGRRCDSCDAGHYGFGNEHGCLPCECNPFGSVNGSTCDMKTGKCRCRSLAITGRSCDRCYEGSYGFPNCQPCQCHGFSADCDRRTGSCIKCSGKMTGSHCERCQPGYFLDEQDRNCKPCVCNNNSDPSLDEDCDPANGHCLRCLYNTTGNHCEKCKTFYYGNALNQTCKKCNCSLIGTDPSTCGAEGCTCTSDGTCKCLPNAVGKFCEKCTPGFWRKREEECTQCLCDKRGTRAGLMCNQKNGQCPCKSGYFGRSCKSCKRDYTRRKHMKCYGNWRCRWTAYRHYGYGYNLLYNKYWYWNPPIYYGGFYHHTRYYHPLQTKPVRYNLYKEIRTRG